MKISLIGHCNYSIAAELDPETGEAHLIYRTPHQSDDGKKHLWLPEVALNGWFQPIRGLFVALYRDPESPSQLWLQLGAQRFELDAKSNSQFEPEISNEDIAPEHLDAERTFRLYRNDTFQAMHQYRPNEIENQVINIDPFPAWPQEEENEDLLFLVHRILRDDGRWSRVLRSVKR
ncbi:MAG TPA: hypothetical protein VLX28_02480 [Thermoanaerobaculia bacterium]|nr:hypothetical protein [Thermoanaerobaculia bacterium]